MCVEVEKKIIIVKMRGSVASFVCYVTDLVLFVTRLNVGHVFVFVKKKFKLTKKVCWSFRHTPKLGHGMKASRRWLTFVADPAFFGKAHEYLVWLN